MLNKDALARRLDAAAAAGLLQAAQVAPLADFLAQDSAPQAAVSATIPGEEDLRFVRNFHDVFLATGIILLAIGLSIAVVTAAGGFEAPMLITTAVLFGGCAFIMEALGEVFSKRRRLFLPSIAICVSFVAFCVHAAMSA